MMRNFFFFTSFLVCLSNVSFAQVSANFTSGGSVRLGSTSAACTPALTGSLRWSSALNTIEVCDGQSDWRLVVSAGSAGVAATPAPQHGYFILSQNTYDGVMGGLMGMHQKCVDEVQNNDWLGKSDAQARGLINYAHIKPWACYSSHCDELASGASYKFAVAGSPTVGGDSFTVGADSLTLDSVAWNGPTRFGGTYTYWTAREAGTATVPGVASYQPCQNWTSNADVWNVAANAGNSSSNNSGRWNATRPTCINFHRLICVVHP